MLVGGITWAKGQVDTPHGPIVVDWTTENVGQDFTVNVNVPNGTKGNVAVPVEESAKVAVNGIPVYSNGKRGASGAKYESGYVVVRLEEGEHTVTASA